MGVDDNVSMNRVWGLTGGFLEEENDVNHAALQKESWEKLITSSFVLFLKNLLDTFIQEILR